jgi:hypothetical protein
MSEAVWARCRIVDIVGRIRFGGRFALIFQRRGRAHALLVNALFQTRRIALGEGMDVFWSFVPISPSTTQWVFFRGRELSRLSGCRRLQVRKGGVFSKV